MYISSTISENINARRQSNLLNYNDKKTYSRKDKEPQSETAFGEAFSCPHMKKIKKNSLEIKQINQLLRSPHFLTDLHTFQTYLNS